MLKDYIARLRTKLDAVEEKVNAGVGTAEDDILAALLKAEAAVDDVLAKLEG